MLQEMSLIQPGFVTICKMVMENISRMKTALQHKGQEVFQNSELFPKANALNVTKSFPCYPGLVVMTSMLLIDSFFTTVIC